VLRPLLVSIVLGCIALAGIAVPLALTVAADPSPSAFTVQRFDHEAYLQPVAGLDRLELRAFQQAFR
jgi:hypothetical protein